MSEIILNVNVAVEIENKTICVPCNIETTAEDVCIFLSKQLLISPLARHIFALRIEKSVFLPPKAPVYDHKNSYIDFRIRFKVNNVLKLAKIDPNSYNYYFHQARIDVLENKVPGLIYEQYRRELLGLGITDMHRYILEKGTAMSSVERDYKKFIPKEVVKRHPFFMKAPIHNTLVGLQKSVKSVKQVKAEYIQQLELIGPEYLSEEYKAFHDKDGQTCLVIVKVSPIQSEGVKYCFESKKEQWHHICKIEEISSVSIRENTVEIYTNRTPIYLRFHAKSIMFSFISLLDGYYRLSCKWTFNICRDVAMLSLENLKALKCHGPVGSDFSYTKLKEKRNNKFGCYLLRESEKNYDVFYIDVCMQNGKILSFKLDKISESEYLFHDDSTKYKSIQDILKAYKDPDGAIYLGECLPPSDYDVSPLLLCKSDTLNNDSQVVNSTSLDDILAAPLCISPEDLKREEKGFKKGLRGKTVVYKAIWRPTRNKELEVAMKMLNKESTDIYFKDFFNLAGKWAFLKSGSLVRFYGLALLPNSICSVLEYLPLGPLDRYLREKRDILKPEDLIEASSNLASALWHLTESNVVHGKIRCRKLLVNVHNENRFTVKLTDPGLHTSYDGNEIHWMPVECYADGMSSFESAKESAAADIWAFATTVWEIFSFGEKLIYHLGSQESYLKGERLAKPPACDESMYKIMLKCWNADPDARIQPQELMRDVNQILYAVYDSRRTHSYARPLPSAKISVSASTAASEAKTETTDIEDLWGNMDDYKFNSDAILELDESNVIPQGDIGHGFYGDVFRAAYYQEGSPEPIPVAVKKLRDPARTSLQDFEREINIMKQLNHPNIVKILGIIRDNESSNGQKISLVMEYIHLGSLRNHLQHYKDSVKYEQLLKYASDIAKGMEYLGSVNIVHRDLAARNILVVDKNHVKITDFGLARVLGASDYYILRTERNLPIKWYAPESLANGKFSVRSDVWSYGVTMCEMFNHGEEPQLEKSGDANSQEDFLRALEEGDRFPKPQLCPPAVYQRIIWPCWNIMSHSRPSFSELIVETDDLLKEF